MKTKLLLITACIAALTGCGTLTTPRAIMDVDDLNDYSIDCSRKEEQLAFLQSHMPSQSEQYSNALSMTSMFGWFNSASQGTFKEDRALFDGEQQAIARIIIHKLNAYCQTPVVKPQGCVTLNESMPSGASGGTQCYQNNKGKPQTKSNRWEATVNN